MIDLSLAGLLGAVLGTVAAAMAYGPLLAFAERSFWAMRIIEPAQELPENHRAKVALPRSNGLL